MTFDLGDATLQQCGEVRWWFMLLHGDNLCVTQAHQDICDYNDASSLCCRLCMWRLTTQWPSQLGPWALPAPRHTLQRCLIISLYHHRTTFVIQLASDTYAELCNGACVHPVAHAIPCS